MVLGEKARFYIVGYMLPRGWNVCQGIGRAPCGTKILKDNARSSHVGQLFSNSAGKSISRMGRLEQLFRSEQLSQEDSGDLIEPSGNILEDIHQVWKYHG